MKANRRFQVQDEGVSPVIAVILMVAITVVLAATVYVWVSGFGESGSQAKQLSASPVSTTNGLAVLSIVSVSPNFNFDQLKIVLEGPTNYGIYANGVIARNTAWESTASGTIEAGDIVKIAHQDGGSSIIAKFVDMASNTQVAQMTVSVGQDTTGPVVSSMTCAASATVTLSEQAYYVTAGALAAPTTGNVWTYVDTTSATSAETLDSHTWTHSSLTQALTFSADPDATDTIALQATASDLAGNAAQTTAYACT